MVRFQVHLFKGLHCDKGNSENLTQIWISAKISFQLLKFISVSSSAYGIWQALNNWWSLSMWLLIMSHNSNHLGSPPLSSWAFCLFLTFLSSPFKLVQKFLLWPWSMNSGFLLPDYFSDATSLLLFQQLQSICVGIYWSSAHLLETPSYFSDHYLSRSFCLKLEVIVTLGYHYYVLWSGTLILQSLHLSISDFW